MPHKLLTNRYTFFLILWLRLTKPDAMRAGKARHSRAATAPTEAVITGAHLEIQSVVEGIRRVGFDTSNN